MPSWRKWLPSRSPESSIRLITRSRSRRLLTPRRQATGVLEKRFLTGSPGIAEGGIADGRMARGIRVVRPRSFLSGWSLASTTVPALRGGTTYRPNQGSPDQRSHPHPHRPRHRSRWGTDRNPGNPRGARLCPGTAAGSRGSFADGAPARMPGDGLREVQVRAEQEAPEGAEEAARHASQGSQVAPEDRGARLPIQGEQRTPLPRAARQGEVHGDVPW